MEVGRTIILIGIIVIVFGLLLLLQPRLFHWFGNLPGDIRIERSNSRFFIPITSMLIVSIVLTIVFNIFGWLLSLISKWK